MNLRSQAQRNKGKEQINPGSGLIEVELKAWVKDLKPLQKRVERIARRKEEILEEDLYFTFANTTGYQRQRFRLRKIGEKAIVTVKVPELSSVSSGLRTKEQSGQKRAFSVDANREFEFEVSDPDAFKVFCQQFGFRVLIEKLKKVKRYQLKRSYLRGFNLPVVIELNQVKGLGDFIELEAKVKEKAQVPKASRFLKSLLNQLGIAPSQIEPIPYTELLYRKKFKSLQ